MKNGSRFERESGIWWLCSVGSRARNGVFGFVNYYSGGRFWGPWHKKCKRVLGLGVVVFVCRGALVMGASFLSCFVG